MTKIWKTISTILLSVLLPPAIIVSVAIFFSDEDKRELLRYLVKSSNSFAPEWVGMSLFFVLVFPFMLGPIYGYARIVEKIWKGEKPPRIIQKFKTFFKFIGEKLISFFDWRNGISRIQYFRGWIFRSTLIVSISIVSWLIWWAFGWYAEIDLSKEVLGESDSHIIFLLLSDTLPIVTVSSFILTVPWDLRRMKDAGISWWWIVPFEFLIHMPSPPDDVVSIELLGERLAYAFFCITPCVIFWLVLFFQPGKIYRKFAQDKFNRTRKNRITFSD